MDTPKIETTKFEDLEFPETVYKYRNMLNLNHLSILTNQIVYFAPPNSFEDEFDCKIPIRYDLLTSDDIFEKYYQELKKINPKWDPMFLRDEAIRWANRNLLTDPKRLNALEEHYWSEFNQVFGILSVTAVPDNILMWKKYSENFNGFCVGFDPKIFFKGMGGGGMVHYFDSLPLIMPFDDTFTQRNNLTFSKLKKWEFEKEYRLQKMWPFKVTDSDRQFIVSKEAFTEIILGEKLSDKDKKLIIQTSRNINPDIKLKIATIKNNEVQINIFA